MAEERKYPEAAEPVPPPARALYAAGPPGLMAKPHTRIIRVRLDQLVFQDYSHRAEGALGQDELQSLFNNIKTEGLKHQPEVFDKGDSTYVLVTGHRRVTCLRLLAVDGVAGFSTDMEVEVVELLDTTPLDRLAWSVADNEVRLNLSAAERFDVVEKFIKAGMPDERGATALGLSLKQYQRDCLLVRSEWMLTLVNKKAVLATTAVKLLEAAGKHNRLGELKRFLEDWAAEQELEIEAEGQKRNLKPSERLVQSRLTPELRQHWLEQLARKVDLDVEAQKKIQVDLNPKTLQVAVEGFKLDLKTDPLDEIARVLATLSQIAKNAAPILKTRMALEGAEGPQAWLLNAMNAQQYDTDFLRNAGLEDLVPLPKPEFLTEANTHNKSLDANGGT